VRNLNGKVAVVTGAASGIGRAMAESFAAEGMKVVLADIEAQALDSTFADMKRRGATVASLRVDVSRGDEVEGLARFAVETFGGVHVVCNNAGVPPVVSPSWTLTESDWQWVLGVNLWGVLHGVRVFVPIMLEQDSEGHVVNTASIAGLLSAPWATTYDVAKHGVVTLSESLYRELAAIGSKVRVSVLCPAWVKTQLMDGGRNRPSAVPVKTGDEAVTPQAALMEQAVRQLVANGTDAGEIGKLVVSAIREERFYILPHPEWKEQIRSRMEDIIQERNPSTETTL
jgi:NAD(P)-dependent dehydrogenase (short-subunit alcohol dehydrogenase family)